MTILEELQKVEFLAVNASELSKKCFFCLNTICTRKLSLVGQAARGYLAPEKSVAGIAQVICFGSK